MGRRSTNNTKAGKYMNPTDQARKEARRKELKKNRKQRAIVRESVIKQKEPKQLLAELEALDAIEFDVNTRPPYSVKVIHEKRKKLKEAWRRVVEFYQKDDAKLAAELKQQEAEYERRFAQMSQHYESVMQAQHVKLDDIPMPIDMPVAYPSEQAQQQQASTSLTMMTPFMPPPPPMLIPPPPLAATPATYSASATTTTTAPKSILKSTPDVAAKQQQQQPPGPPSGPPPDLSEFECDDDEAELGLSLSDTYQSSDKSKKIRFSSDNESRSVEPSSASSTTTAAATPAPSSATSSARPPVLAPLSSDLMMSSAQYSRHFVPPPPPPPPPAQSAPSRFAQPPPQKPVGYQPGQPSYYQQQRPNFYQQPGQNVSKLVTPQPPPPPPPPPPSHQHKQQQHQHQHQQQNAHAGGRVASTIEAKPQMRNKVAEITRFVPTSVAVKRSSAPAKPQRPGEMAYSGVNSSSSFSSGGGASEHRPYNYMSQHQQLYASANPLKSAGEGVTARAHSHTDSLGHQQQHQQQSQSAGGTKVASTDAAYEMFMKEIGKML